MHLRVQKNIWQFVTRERIPWNVILEERERGTGRERERKRGKEREWERNKPAIVYIWHANDTVGNRDGDKIEKEAGQRGTHRLCSDTTGCLISDIDKSVNRERNSLP